MLWKILRNWKRLPRVHIIGCQGVNFLYNKILFLNMGHNLSFFRIWVFKLLSEFDFFVRHPFNLFSSPIEFFGLINLFNNFFCCYLSFWVLFLFEFCHNMSWWVASQFVFLSFVTIWLFKFSHNLSIFFFFLQMEFLKYFFF